MLLRCCLSNNRLLPAVVARSHGTVRSFRSTAASRDKILAVLYPDPITGYPPDYPRSSIPQITSYPDGQTTPSPSRIDYTPGELLGCVSGELGLRKFLQENGHELVVTADKDGPDSEFESHLPTAHYVISQPFWPAYLTEERISKAKLLKASITAGVGSDHVDLDAAMKHNIDVCEVTYCNSISVVRFRLFQKHVWYQAVTC